MYGAMCCLLQWLAALASRPPPPLAHSGSLLGSTGRCSSRSRRRALISAVMEAGSSGGSEGRDSDSQRIESRVGGDAALVTE